MSKTSPVVMLFACPFQMHCHPGHGTLIAHDTLNCACHPKPYVKKFRQIRCLLKRDAVTNDEVNSRTKSDLFERAMQESSF